MNTIRKNKGFSLVELLAVVVIMGILATIGIAAVSSLIDKADKEYENSHKNTIIIAAQTYMQSNKNLVPKVVGENVKVNVSELRKANYLKEDIKNKNGETCMENSYVRVYKASNTEYTYTAFIYCGSEAVPEEEEIPLPEVEANFSDSSGEIKEVNLNNVSDAYLHIDMKAAKAEEMQDLKNQGTNIAIDGYTFRIFVVKDGKRFEAYNSGSLSAGKKEELKITKRLKDYIDVTGVTEVALDITVINTVGGVTNKSTTSGETGDKDTSKYNDKIPPRCIKPSNPYNENDWLNKNEYKLSNNVRKITVGCDDGLGSQCIREYFTKSWPNDENEYGAEFVYIEVKDNAGNISEHNDDCKFRINVDIKTPTATVTAYKGLKSTKNDSNSLADKITGDNILKKTVKASDSSTTKEIKPTDAYYENLVGNDSTNKWMNKDNYSNGVIYKIELKDNIRLDRWTWETNEGYINSMKVSNYLTVNSNNPESSSGVVPQDEEHGMTDLHGSTKDVVYVRFLTEGMRYGVFTAYDKAGNSVKIKIAAHLDRTAPPIPEKLNAYVYNKVRTDGTKPSSTSYTFGTWTNKYVRVETASGQNKDNLSNDVTLSGFWQFYYDARNNSNKRVGEGDYNTNESGKGVYDFKGIAKKVDGKNKIRFKGCDKAGNCSSWGEYKEEWIDITIPTCTVVKSITKGAESSYGWLGIGETARVTATCNDPTETLESGCATQSFSHDYDYQINTETAGAEGNNKGGSFKDNAGNSIDCTATQRIQIDYEKPKCSVSGGSTSWTNNSRTITGTCSDTGGSNCVKNISFKYDFDIETTTAGPAGNNAGGTVTDKADNVISCLENQTVKVDRTKPYITVDVAPGTYESNTDINVTATCHDDLSGLSSRFAVSYTGTMFAPTTGQSIAKCCEDKAGNEMCDDRGPYKIKIYGPHEVCGVKNYFTCSTSNCGVKSYKECQNSACGTKEETTTPTQKGETKTRPSNGYTCENVDSAIMCAGKSSCECNFSYPNCICTYPTLCPSGYSVSGTSCVKSVYKKCRTEECGVESYNECEDSACGVKEHNSCWHFEKDCNCSNHKKLK